MLIRGRHSVQHIRLFLILSELRVSQLDQTYVMTAPPQAPRESDIFIRLIRLNSSLLSAAKKTQNTTANKQTNKQTNKQIRCCKQTTRRTWRRHLKHPGNQIVLSVSSVWLPSLLCAYRSYKPTLLTLITLQTNKNRTPQAPRKSDSLIPLLFGWSHWEESQLSQALSCWLSSLPSADWS